MLFMQVGAMDHVVVNMVFSFLITIDTESSTDGPEKPRRVGRVALSVTP